jgi:hypothetical protein
LAGKTQLDCESDGVTSRFHSLTTVDGLVSAMPKTVPNLMLMRP